jgi:hypothetical protein
LASHYVCHITKTSSRTIDELTIAKLFFALENQASFCFENSLAPSYLMEILGGNHFVYCDRDIAPRSGGTTIQHQTIIEITLSFVQKHVLGEDVRVKASKSKNI